MGTGIGATVHCDKCKHEPDSGDSSSHSSNSPRLGDREGLCQCSTGHGSHGCRNITTHANGLCDDCEMPTGNGEGDMGCICDCDQCEPSLPHESQWAPGRPSAPWYPHGNPEPESSSGDEANAILWDSQDDSSNGGSGEDELRVHQRDREGGS